MEGFDLGSKILSCLKQLFNFGNLVQVGLFKCFFATLDISNWRDFRIDLEEMPSWEGNMERVLDNEFFVGLFGVVVSGCLVFGPLDFIRAPPFLLSLAPTPPPKTKNQKPHMQKQQKWPHQKNMAFKREFESLSNWEPPDRF